MQTGGLFRNAINDYYDPIPPRPNGVNIYQYDGNGDPQSAEQLPPVERQQSIHELGPEP